MKKSIILIIATIICLALFNSCEKETFTIEPQSALETDPSGTPIAKADPLFHFDESKAEQADFKPAQTDLSFRSERRLLYTRTVSLEEDELRDVVYWTRENLAPGWDMIATLTPISGDPDIFIKGKSGDSYRIIGKSRKWGSAIDETSCRTLELKASESELHFFIHGWTKTTAKLEIFIVWMGNEIKSSSNQFYPTIRTGNLTWTAKNINEGFKYYYDDDPTNADHFGGLYYNQGDARRACADLGTGWRLPVANDIDALIALYDEDKISVQELSENSTYIGTAFDHLVEGGSSGFNMVFSGLRSRNARYSMKETIGQFWLGDGDYLGKVKASFIKDKKRIDYRNATNQTAGSCRCVKEN